MPRLDKYDIVGLVLVGLLVAVWIAHFVLPAPPPVVPGEGYQAGQIQPA